MKVTFVSYDNNTDIGGVSSWLQRLLPELRKRGIEVDINLLSPGGRPGVNCRAFEKLKIPYQLKHWTGDTQSDVYSCMEMAVVSQPDVYIPNCIIPAYFAASLLKKQGVATVGVLHADEPLYHGIIEEFVHGDDRFRLSAVVAVSKFLETRCQNSSLPVQYIPCGVPMPGIQANFDENLFRLVYTGRLEEQQKRIISVTNAFCSIVHSQLNTEAFIVGRGSMQKRVQQLINRKNLQNRIQVLNRIEPGEVYGVLQKCHSFVLLSDYEGLPVSMLEAMAVGVVPICLSMRSGIADVIENGVNGFIIAKVEQLPDIIKALQKNQGRWTDLSNAAIRTVADNYSLEKTADRWEKLFKELALKHDTVTLTSGLILPKSNPKFGYKDQRLPFSNLIRRFSNKFPTVAAYVFDIIGGQRRILKWILALKYKPK